MTLDEFTSLNIFRTISSIQYDKNELIIINIGSYKEQLIIEPPKIKNDPNSLHTKIKDLIGICQNDLKKMALRFNKTLIEYINYKIDLYQKNELAKGGFPLLTHQFISDSKTQLAFIKKQLSNATFLGSGGGSHFLMNQVLVDVYEQLTALMHNR